MTALSVIRHVRLVIRAINRQTLRRKELFVQTPDAHSYLGMHRCGCWGWNLFGKGGVGQGTSHMGDPTLARWWRNTMSWCTRCRSADLGTSGCWLVWSTARSGSLIMGGKKSIREVNKYMNKTLGYCYNQSWKLLCSLFLIPDFINEIVFSNVIHCITHFR